MTRHLASFAIATLTALSLPVGLSAQPPRTINGSGTFASVVTNPSEPLDPPCVLKVVRAGTVTFSGIIQAKDKGKLESTTLSNRCGEVPQGPVVVRYTLDEATIDGKTGAVVIIQRGTFQGAIDSPDGARVTSHMEIWGVSGELRGMLGYGIVTSRSVPTGTTNTYWCELEFRQPDPEK